MNWYWDGVEVATKEWQSRAWSLRWGWLCTVFAACAALESTKAGHDGRIFVEWNGALVDKP